MGTRLDRLGISVWHPTDRPNFTIVAVMGFTFYVSYETVVAFRSPEHGLVVCQNVWSVTTGKHLNWVSDDHKIRVTSEVFQARYDEVKATLDKLQEVDA